MKDMKTFFTGLREIYGPKPRGLIQLKAPDDESVLQGKDKILDRFADHFDQQLKTTPEILLRRLKRPLCNDQLHQVWMNHEISMNQWQLSAQHRMVKLQEGMEFQQNCYLNVTCGLWSVTSKTQISFNRYKLHNLIISLKVSTFSSFCHGSSTFLSSKALLYSNAESFKIQLVSSVGTGIL